MPKGLWPLLPEVTLALDSDTNAFCLRMKCDWKDVSGPFYWKGCGKKFQRERLWGRPGIYAGGFTLTLCSALIDA